MAIFRHIYTKFWEDSLVMEEMNESDRLFALYLLTNRNTKQIGIYQISKKQIEFELDYSSEKVKELINRFQNELNFIVYDEKNSEIAIKNWGKYNLNKGGKPIIDCITKELKEVKNRELINLISKKIEREDIKKIFDAFYNESSTSRGQKEKEKKKENEKEKENIKKELGEKYNEFEYKKSKYTSHYTKDESRNKKPDANKINEIEDYLRNI